MATCEQAREALEIANRVRFAIVRLRGDIKQLGHVEGRVLVADLLQYFQDGDVVGSLTAHRLLLAIPSFGDARAARVIARAEVRSWDRKVRDLTDRQRLLIASELRGDGREPAPRDRG